MFAHHEMRWTLALSQEKERENVSAVTRPKHPSGYSVTDREGDRLDINPNFNTIHHSDVDYCSRLILCGTFHSQGKQGRTFCVGI